MEAGNQGLPVRLCGHSDIGAVREENQDSLVLREPPDEHLRWSRGVLLAIADGMGGLQGGKIASEMAIQTLVEQYYADEGEVIEVLKQAVEEANRRIFRYAREEGRGQPMGSTLTAVAILRSHACIAQVGDSRAYLYHEGDLHQVTRDHSLLRELQESGHVPEDPEVFHMHRNVLTRGLGLREDVQVDLFELNNLDDGDLFLLSSDGLHEVVGEEVITSAIDTYGDDLDGLCKHLIQEALGRGGPDNISVAVALLGHLGPNRGASAEKEPGDDVPGGPSSGWFLPLAFFSTFMAGVGATLLFEERVPPAGSGGTILPERLEEVRQRLEVLKGLKEQSPTSKQEIDTILRLLETEGLRLLETEGEGPEGE